MILVAALAVAGATAGCGGEREQASGGRLEQPRGIEVLDALPKAEPAAADEPPPRVLGSGALTLGQFLDWAGGSANAFWQNQFVRAGYAYSAAGQLQIDVGQKATTECSEASVTVLADDSPFYCSAEQPPTVFLPLEWMHDEARPVGDFAMAYVVAHEWGHHIQFLLGLDEVQANYPRKIRSIHYELMADCLAGVWATSVYFQNLLEAGDVAEALKLAAKIGDPPNIRADHPQAHGNAKQRKKWFRRGYESGRAASCKTWSGDPPNPVE